MFCFRFHIKSLLFFFFNYILLKKYFIRFSSCFQFESEEDWWVSTAGLSRLKYKTYLGTWKLIFFGSNKSYVEFDFFDLNLTIKLPSQNFSCPSPVTAQRHKKSYLRTRKSHAFRASRVVLSIYTLDEFIFQYCSVVRTFKFNKYFFS